MTTTHDKAVHGRECKGSIPIVPFRYAIMPKIEDDSTQYYYDACPTKLDKGFDKLDTAAYSIRTLRPGYIYLYDEDLGTTYLWEADGEGNYTSLQWTSLEDYGKKSNKGSLMQNITVCDESNNVYIAYSQDLWSKKALGKNIKNKDSFMVKLNIQEILNGSGSDSTQANVLPSGRNKEEDGSNPEPAKWIEEYKTPLDKYEQQFGWSSYKPQNVVPMSNLKALAAGSKYADMHKPKLPVFIALYDSVATAIDMGHITTLYMHQLSDIKDLQSQKQTVKQEYKSIPVEMRLDSTKLKSTSVMFYRKKMIADIIDAQLKATFPSATVLKKEGYGFTDIPGAIRKAKEIGRKDGRELGNAEAQFRALTDSGINTDSQRMVKHINKVDLKKFHREKDQEIIRIKKVMARVKESINDSAIVLKTMESQKATHPRYIAAVLGTYDRDNIWSATALEQAIALCIKGMGTPLPGSFKTDPRFELLGTWVETPESPLYVGLKAYNPFKEKLDSSGDLVGGGAGLIGELGDSFKALPATNIIIKEVTTYSIYKVAISKVGITDSSLVASKSTLVVENAMASLTATGGNIKELFKAIQGRYGIVASELSEHAITGEYTKMMAVVGTTDAVYAASLEGSRTTATSTKITRIKAQPMSMAKIKASVTSSGISAGAAIFHIINLETAVASFSRDSSYGASANLGSAVFGTMGAFAELIVSTAVLRQQIAQKITGKVAIKAAQKSLLAKASGPLQFIGAVFEAGSHLIDGYNLGSQGDNDAMAWAGLTAVTLGTAGVLGGIGSLVAAGMISSTVPVAGWIVAAVLFTIAGIAFLFMKLNATDRPMEVWVSRTVFGKPRENYFNKNELVDIPFADLSEELAEYYTLTLSPIKLGDAKGILSKNAESDWEEHGVFDDEVKFTFLLPAFQLGISEWSHKIDGYDGGGVANDKDRDNDTVTESDLALTKNDIHEKKLKNEGLYIYLSKVFSLMKTESAGLEITYWPQGKKGMKIVKTLYVAD